MPFLHFDVQWAQHVCDALPAGRKALTKNAQCIISEVVSRVYTEVHEELDLEECEVFVSVNGKKVLVGDMFLGFPYDQHAVYLFTDDILVHQNISPDPGCVEQNAAEHLYRSLYTTARTKHMGLDADCGLLEEVVNEGLSEFFVTEKMSIDPRKRYMQFSDGEIRRLWKKMSFEFDTASPDVEKWFWGNAIEDVPPFTACSVGFCGCRGIF